VPTRTDDLAASPLRLLHLEDNPCDAELVRHAVIREFPNAQIVHTPDRPGFLAAIKDGRYDLILLDYSLKDFDGIEALQIARAEASGTPVIFVSGTLAEEVIVKAVKNGATDCIPKDKLPRLASAIRGALGEVSESQGRKPGDTVPSPADAVIGKNLEGIITSWNSGAEKLFGYRAAEACGHSITMLMLPDRAAEERRILESVRRGKPVQSFDTVRVRKDGSPVHVSLMISPVRNAEGAVTGASQMAREIPSGQGAAEPPRASEDQYRLLFESNPTPTLLYDHEKLAFLSVNEAAVRHYGFSREEFAAMTLAKLALPEEVPAFVRKLSSLTSEAGNAGIWRHRKKDGKLVEMEITAQPVVFAEKRAWLSLAVDVTERLSLEAQLRQSQKMESVGQLAGGIAHDFNNLLTVITGHTGLLLAMDLAPKVAEPVREISEAAKRAADLTRQLLTFSRKNVLQPLVMDLNEVVNNVGRMLRRILGEDIALEVSFSPSLPSIKADLGMIEQVLLNLAVNSRDAMPRGGKLSINTSSVMIDQARVQQNPEAFTGRYVCLSFADTGCGIPPENLPRIFEPFFTTKELDRGTGLGLATVYGVVKQHQGWIEVSSQVNRGTTFQIFLPASLERGGALSASPGEQRVIGGTETLLVVEDEAPLLKLMDHILGSYGYEVLGCSSGKAALELWGEHRARIDLLLTDMILPDGMAGPELAQILKSAKPGIKVVYTSGYNTEKLMKEFTMDDGSNFLQKPFHARKLAETVYDCLSGK
jgi:two-component system, cell cycle sensor histidine kinase and response regulator CckA